MNAKDITLEGKLSLSTTDMVLLRLILLVEFLLLLLCVLLCLELLLRRVLVGVVAGHVVVLSVLGPPQQTPEAFTQQPPLVLVPPGTSCRRM